MDGGKIIERIGDYFLQETGSAYEVYSGYAYVACYQPPTLCGPVQLAGFGRSQLDSAKAFLKGKADADAEGVQFRKRKADVTSMLAKGWAPCPHDDSELRRHLMGKGYTLAKVTKSHQWFEPPVANLFNPAH